MTKLEELMHKRDRLCCNCYIPRCRGSNCTEYYDVSKEIWRELRRIFGKEADENGKG